MKQRVVKIVFIVLFLLLLYVPTAVWVLAGGRLKNENLENRVLTEKPQFSLANLEKLPSLYEKYYRDNLPFRNQLISLYAHEERALFYNPIVTTVTFGKGNWLYYINVNQGNPVASYRGEDLFSPEELRNIVINLRKTRDNLKKIGCDFVLLLAPNKFRVYPEYFPDYYGEMGETSAIGQLYDFVKKHTDIKILYAYDQLMQAKADFPDVPIYFTTDTHWNRVGSYTASKLLMDTLNIQLPALSRENIVQKETPYAGDLTKLTHLSDTMAVDREYYVKDEARPKYTQKNTNNGLVHYGWSDAGQGRKLFIRTDSFGELMLEYLMPYFSQTVAMYNSEYEHQAVDELQPDVFVQVCLERIMWEQLLNGPLYVLPEDR